MALQNKTVRLTDETHKQLTQQFGSFANACQLLLEPFDRLRKLNNEKMKEYFSEAELNAIRDSQNGLVQTPDFIYSKQFFIAQIEDFERFENGISRHKVEASDLIEKINKLSNVEVYYLVLDCVVFWNGVSGK